MASTIIASFLVGFLVAIVMISNSEKVTWVSKDLHVKHDGYIYKMTKVEKDDNN